jgi:nicotinate-nucleotide pyrophosphorylase (carboxylating)
MITPRTELLIDLALEEDLGLGDLTSRAIFPARHRSRAIIEAREALVVCGLAIATRVFARVDPLLRVAALVADGDQVRAGTAVMRVEGPTASLLAAERTALNFLQRL